MCLFLSFLKSKSQSHDWNLHYLGSKSYILPTNVHEFLLWDKALKAPLNCALVLQERAFETTPAIKCLFMKYFSIYHLNLMHLFFFWGPFILRPISNMRKLRLTEDELPAWSYVAAWTRARVSWLLQCGIWESSLKTRGGLCVPGSSDLHRARFFLPCLCHPGHPWQLRLFVRPQPLILALSPLVTDDSRG